MISIIDSKMKTRYPNIKDKFFRNRKQTVKTICLSIVFMFVLYFLFVVGTIAVAMLPPSGHFNVTSMVFFSKFGLKFKRFLFYVGYRIQGDAL